MAHQITSANAAHRKRTGKSSTSVSWHGQDFVRRKAVLIRQRLARMSKKKIAAQPSGMSSRFATSTTNALGRPLMSATVLRLPRQTEVKHVRKQVRSERRGMKTTDQLCRIAASGGSMEIDASKLTTDQLCQIAATCKVNRRLILRGVDSKTTDQLCRIAAAGNVVFVF